MTSASLATLGGGSLAADGLGIAGGAAMISGGGALLGMLGGTGLSAATSISVLPDNGVVLDECTKLLVYCRDVLSDSDRTQNDLTAIDTEIKGKIDEVENQLTAIESNDEMDKKQRKTAASVCKKNIKYLSRCEIELRKMIENKSTQE